MRQAMLVLLFLCVAAGSARSQEPVNTGSVQDIYNHLAGVIAKAESVDFHGTHHCAGTEIEPAVDHKPAGTPPASIDADVRFRARGVKYDFTERFKGEADGATRANELAWDGKYYQVLMLKMGFLLISKQNPDNNHLRVGINSALKMFDFLLPQSRLQQGPPTVGWDLVKNLNAWNACLGSAHLVGPVIFQGKPCSLVMIPNAEYRALHPPIPRCTYTVYFSWNDGMFPAGWKIEDEHHRILEDYRVEEFGQETFGEGQIFYYPKKTTGAFYPDRDFPPGQPQAIYTSTYESFRVNTIADDTAFTIDRATVLQVNNLDTGVVTATRPPARGPGGEVIRVP